MSWGPALPSRQADAPASAVAGWKPADPAALEGNENAGPVDGEDIPNDEAPAMLPGRDPRQNVDEGPAPPPPGRDPLAKVSLGAVPPSPGNELRE